MKTYKYLNGDIIIDIKESYLDNAQYLMLVLGALNEGKNLSQEHLKEVEKFGIRLGVYQDSFGENYEFYISGQPVINNNQGESITDAKKLKEILSQGKEEDLHYSSLSYIQVKNTSNPEKFYGVFYNITDAIAEINSGR